MLPTVVASPVLRNPILRTHLSSEVAHAILATPNPSDLVSDLHATSPHISGPLRTHILRLHISEIPKFRNSALLRSSENSENPKFCSLTTLLHSFSSSAPCYSTPRNSETPLFSDSLIL